MNVVKVVIEGSIWLVLFEVLCLIVVYAFIFLWRPYKCEGIWRKLNIIAFSVFCLFSLGLGIWIGVTRTYLKTYIYATMDDTVSFNYIHNNYEILSEEDGVYKLKEK